MVTADYVTKVSLDTAGFRVPGSDSLPVMTAKPVGVGESVSAGESVIEIAGRPMIVLPGRFPAYRSLERGDRGPDVEQLQRGLAALGLSTEGDQPGEFGMVTSRAARTLYQRAGYEPLSDTTGSLIVPRGEILFVPSVPMGLISLSASVGDTIDRSSLLLALASEGRGIEIRISGRVTGMIRPGQTVTVNLPIGNVEGTLAGVRAASTVIQDEPMSRSSTSSEGETPRLTRGSEEWLSAEVILDQPLPPDSLGLEGTAVIEVETSDPGLIVPALAIRGDGSNFWVLRSRSEEPEKIPVDLLFSAQGRVVIGVEDGIEAGDRVIMDTAGARS